jgi:curli biogenesis system outer membrane secretion channel CsgG
MVDYRLPTDGTGALISNILITELVKSKRVTVLERKNLDRILKELKLGAVSGYVDPENALKLGKLANVDYIITGKIVDYQLQNRAGGFIDFKFMSSTGVVGTEVRIIDVETGQILKADTIYGEEKDSHFRFDPDRFRPKSGDFNNTVLGKALRYCAEEIALFATEDIPIRGKVVKVKDDLVQINLGIGEVTKNMELIVSRKGVAITDPDNESVILGYEQDRIGKIRVTNVYEKYSNAEILEDDKDIKRGDTVLKE